MKTLSNNNISSLIRWDALSIILLDKREKVLYIRSKTYVLKLHNTISNSTKLKNGLMGDRTLSLVSYFLFLTNESVFANQSLPVSLFLYPRT